jgi:hypothetical protein
MKQFLILLLIITGSTFAQISITSSDISNQYMVGSIYTTKTDTSVTQADIGQLGSTSWDFGSLTANSGLTIQSTVVDPNSTPYISSFPGANISVHSQINIGPGSGDTYSYQSINGSFDYHGSVSVGEFAPGITSVTTSTLNPIETTANFPFTYSSMLNYSGTRTTTTEIPGFPTITSMTTVVSNTVVDAYGQLTLPGGRMVDALRLKHDQINILQGPFPIYSRSLSYTFLAADGSQVSVPSDTTQPLTGVINTSASVSWTDRAVSDVRVGESIPSDYRLSQNFPNPFNPSTSIEYSVPEQSFVELKVFDILGNEVAVLVNEEKPAGNYKVEFSAIGGSASGGNASDLPSGMYIARFSSGSFTNVVKMTLLK